MTHNNRSAKNSEPFIRIARKDGTNSRSSWMIRIAALLFALVLCGIFVFIVKKANPIELYRDMFMGTFRSVNKMKSTLLYIAPLLCVGIALAPAFKMRFWNIGGEGQVLIGGFAAAFCAIKFSAVLPSPVLIIVMFLAAVAAGAVWGLIPALFRAYWDTNETLFTLMMNYIALNIVLLAGEIWRGKNTVMGLVSQKAWLPKLFGQSFLLPVIFVVILALFMNFYLKYTKHGYEISVVGESHNTARYAGISVKKVITRTIAISGAICGFCGFIMVSGIDHTLSGNTAGGRGFTAIIVAWLAKFNTIYMLMTAALLVFLDNAASELSTTLGLHESISKVMSGIILFCILGCEFFINYRVILKKNSAKEAGK